MLDLNGPRRRAVASSVRYFERGLPMPSAVRAHQRGRPIVLPGAILFWHLRRKAAGVDAEIDERVDDDSANKRGDHG
jgi:hypothetical protein